MTIDQLFLHSHCYYYFYFFDDPHHSDLGSYVIYLFKNYFFNNNPAYLKPDASDHLIAL